MDFLVDLLLGLLLFAGIIIAVLFFKGELKPSKVKKMKEDVDRDFAKTWLNNYQNSLHYQFYDACLKRGVKNLDSPENMAVAMEILRYDHRFAKWEKTQEIARKQWKNALCAIAKAEEYRAQLDHLTNKRENDELSMYGEHGYAILSALRKNPQNWKNYRNNGIVSALCCVDNSEMYYIIFKGKTGIYTYNSQSKKVTQGIPNAYTFKSLDADIVHVPTTATYTSVTVGGVTTGGWDIKEAHNEVRWSHKGNYGVKVGFGSIKDVNDHLKYIWLNDAMLKFVDYNEILKPTVEDEEKIYVGYRTKEFCDTVVAMMGHI